MDLTMLTYFGFDVPDDAILRDWPLVQIIKIVDLAGDVIDDKSGSFCLVLVGGERWAKSKPLPSYAVGFP